VEAVSEPVLVLAFSASDVTGLAPYLVDWIRRDYVARDRRAPRQLVELADAVSIAARSSASRASSAHPGTSRECGTGAEFRAGPSVPSSRQPETLDTREAARRAEVSTGYLRRLCRLRVIETLPRRDGRSSYRVVTDSLEAWVSARREGTRRKAA
jgi:hypothetical protein